MGQSHPKKCPQLCFLEVILTLSLKQISLTGLNENPVASNPTLGDFRGKLRTVQMSKREFF